MAIARCRTNYPVNIEVDPTTDPRNKMTVGFRFILAIPHALLVGGFLLASGPSSPRKITLADSSIRECWVQSLVSAR